MEQRRVLAVRESLSDHEEDLDASDVGRGRDGLFVGDPARRDVRPGGVKTERGFKGYGVSRNEIPQNQTMIHLWVIGLDKIQITRLL